jgi:hypothetical protein
MIISKPVIVCHACQIFFAFVAMCCFASVAAFQAKWKVGPCEFPASPLDSALALVSVRRGQVMPHNSLLRHSALLYCGLLACLT